MRWRCLVTVLVLAGLVTTLLAGGSKQNGTTQPSAYIPVGSRCDFGNGCDLPAGGLYTVGVLEYRLIAVDDLFPQNRHCRTCVEKQVFTNETPCEDTQQWEVCGQAACRQVIERVVFTPTGGGEPMVLETLSDDITHFDVYSQQCNSPALHQCDEWGPDGWNFYLWF